MRSGSGLSRREFIATATGAGLYIAFRIEDALAQEPRRLPTRQGSPSDFNAYLRIGADGRTTCFVGKIEMGQGAMTSLAQMLAEELDVPFDSVDMVMGDTDLCPWDMGTWGSLTTRQLGPVVRAAAAEARAVLIQLAAERLAVGADQLQARSGVISKVKEPGIRVTYAQLVGGKRIERHLAHVPTKAASTFIVMGKPAARKDALEKVTGRARYAADMAPAGVLHARVLHPPVHGAKLSSLDTGAAERIGGARVVHEGDLVAVLHERPDIAASALATVRAEWTRPTPLVDDTTIFDHIVKHAPASDVVADSGDLAQGRKLAASLFERRYLNSYVAHAPMETHSAAATIDNGKVTVWASTQTPFGIKGQIAKALDVAPERVRVIAPYVGGGFGGKSAGRQAIEAALLAKLVGRPVQVVWDRAEEFFFDTFRPAAVVDIRSGLTGAGRIAFWECDVICAGDREAKPFYDIAYQRVTSAGGWGGQQPPGLHPFAVGPWRGPSVNTITFARESQIDIMAAAAKSDPLRFRLDQLSDARMRHVLDSAARRFGWTPAPSPSGRGIGVACATYSDTYVAMFAEVAVDKTTGRVHVKRVVCALDMGLVVNPDGARQQSEGSITMGLGYALTEEVRFFGGEVRERNFDSYQIPRFSWLPEIETLLIDNPQTPASGCGEPPIVCMGAVIANAIFDATGARLLQLPMTPARVKAALTGG